MDDIEAFCGGEKTVESDMLPHTIGEWETEIEAQVGVEGKAVKKCTVCGSTVEEKTIAAIKEPNVDDNNGNYSNGNNGNNNNNTGSSCISSVTAAFGSIFMGFAAAFELLVKHRMF